jgi:predicted amidohydrolase YtcJ
MAISDGKIVAIGKSVDLQKEYSAKKEIDAKGKAIYPGFIDGHAHFLAYGLGLNTVDLVDTKSWEEIVAKVKVFATQNTQGWILGRGWDQNDWENKSFPNKKHMKI